MHQMRGEPPDRPRGVGGLVGEQTGGWGGGVGRADEQAKGKRNDGIGESAFSAARCSC